MKNHFVIIVSLLTSMGVFCLCGCQSVAQQLSNPSKNARTKGAQAYAELSQAEQTAVHNELFTIALTHPDAVHRYLAVEQIKDKDVLFKIAQKDNNIRIRQTAIAKVFDTKMLVEIAKTEMEEKVAQAAVVNLSDQSALAVLAKDAPLSNIRHMALMKLEDVHPMKQVYYAKIAISSEPSKTCLAAGEKLVDQTLIANVAQHSKDVATRICVIQKLMDETVLIAIAKTDENSDVCQAAVKKLTDQTVLADLAKTNKFPNVRQVAVEKLIDQTVIADVAKTDKDYVVRQTAVEKLTDQALLADVAKNATNPNVRQVAVEKLINQTVLADIAKTDKDYVVHQTAVEKLTDQALLADIAKNATYSNVRRFAVKKLADQTVLANIAKTDNDYVVRQTAVEKLTSQALLADVAKNATDFNVRRTAVKKLANQTVLADIAKTDNDDVVRQTAVEKLTDQALLADVAKNATNFNVRRSAVKKLADQTVLANIAKTDKDDVVRRTAVEKLSDQALLADVAKTANDINICSIASAKIIDIQQLVAIAYTTPFDSLKTSLIARAPTDPRMFKIKHGIPMEAQRLTVKAGRLLSGIYYIDDAQYILLTTIHVPAEQEVTIYLCGNKIEDSDIVIDKGGTLTLKQGALFQSSENVIALDAARNFFEIRNRGTLTLEDVYLYTRVVNHGDLTLVRSKIGNKKNSFIFALEKHSIWLNKSSLKDIRADYNRLNNNYKIDFSGIENYGTLTASNECLIETLLNNKNSQCTVQQSTISLLYNNQQAKTTLRSVLLGGISNTGEMSMSGVLCSLFENEGSVNSKIATFDQFQNEGTLICENGTFSQFENKMGASAILTACTLRTRNEKTQSVDWFETTTFQRNKGRDVRINNEGRLALRHGSNIVDATIDNYGTLSLSGEIASKNLRLNAHNKGILHGGENIKGVYYPYKGECIVIVDNHSHMGDTVISKCLPGMFVARLSSRLDVEEKPAGELVDLIVIGEEWRSGEQF